MFLFGLSLLIVATGMGYHVAQLLHMKTYNNEVNLFGLCEI